MDEYFEYQGTTFTWDREKARRTERKRGIQFQQAAEVFFDPFVRLVDATRNDEARDAAIGYDLKQRLLYVVNIQLEDDAIRIISVREATPEDREIYDS
ncbi:MULTISPECIES: BrnT family toxin [Xanthomonas]|uniref:BrnT family toxin n=1 Tax=Xanthomonas TaxID=338 RepID=UPI00201936E2|nr:MULTISPECIES: BrnT family toxin [Xanthomonas]MDO0852981.1 BrnT family toxin [Xanthomonas campestris pv. campestris]MEB1908519.1 BrnT family toxin [Xanthomonas campestris pv. campestris]UQQ14978.1 BrnT family toxin [Xanthomonas arboricola pv. corylina]WDJ45785.1 BrnT family toxin [Xanthomonas campestris pv. campestris]